MYDCAASDTFLAASARAINGGNGGMLSCDKRTLMKMYVRMWCSAYIVE